MTTQVSFFENMSVPTGLMSLQQVYDVITGDDLIEETNQLRILLKEGNKTEFDNLKKKLPSVTFSGEFENGRKAENLFSYTQHVCLDFDKIPTQEQLDRAKQVIKEIDVTKVMFVSPSGKGLKVVVEVDSTKDDHKNVYAQVAKYYEDKIGFPADHTSDISRLTFLCHDKDAFYNELYEVFSYKPMEKKVKQHSVAALDCQARDIFEYAVGFTEKKVKFEEGSRNKFVFVLASNCNRWGLCQDFVTDLCVERFGEDGFDSDEIERAVNSSYRNVDMHSSWKRPGLFAHTATTAEAVPPVSVAIASDTTPYFDEGVYQNLPGLMRETAELFNNKRERDMYLISYLTLLSGHLHNIHGWYRNNDVYPNLFSLLISPSAFGKSAMSKAVDIFSLLDANRKTQYAPLISINGTFKSIITRLYSSDGVGILYDEEIEALSKFLKHDVNGLSYLLKQGYDNRILRNGRITSDQKMIEVPKFSFLTAGNPHQLVKVVPSTLDGAYSRNLYYTFSEIQAFESVKPGGWMQFSEQRDEYLGQLSAFIDFALSNPFVFSLTDDQFERVRLNAQALERQYAGIESISMNQIIKRGGAAIFKIAMIFSVFRKWSEGNSELKYVCQDIDFYIALSMVDTLTVHANFAGKMLTDEGKQTFPKPEDKKAKLIGAMPDCFNRQEALATVKDLDLGISDRTVDNYLKGMLGDGVLQHTHNKYCKVVS